MATLIFTAIGTLIGGPLGGSVGALLGRQVDTLVFGGGSREGPRLSELSVTTSSYGYPLPRQFGRMRVAGQIIWATDLVEHKDKHGNGKGKPSTVEYSYTASFAVALASRPVERIGRIWADGKLLRGTSGDLKTGGTFRFYGGTGNQQPDPLLAAAEGAGRCPAYRGLAYAVFEDLQLGDFGNRIPALTFEVIADTAPLSLDLLLDGVIEDGDAAVPLPGLAGLALDGPVAEVLAALDPFYPVDCDACDARLTIRPDRNQAAPIPLPEAATSTKQDDFGGNAGYARKRGGESESPIAVLRYYDVDRDFQPGAQRASGRPLPGQPRTAELPAALEAGTARALIEAAARRDQWSRQTMAWRVTQLDPAVRPGALVTVPGHAGQWRVREWEWREHGVDLTLNRQFPASKPVTNGTVADPGRIGQLADSAPAAARLAACELPWDGNAGTPVPLLLAAVSATGASWTGVSLYADQGDGALLPLGTSGRARAVIGTALTALPLASPLLFDRTGSVTIELAGADLLLTDATMRQLAMGANRAVLGQEILQFAAAEPLGGGRWKLSGLWRGRGGTENAVGSHAAGESFILLGGNATVLDPDTVGNVPGTLIAAIGLGDDSPVTAPIALRGIGTRPLSPVHGAFAKDAAGAAVLHWTRRGRGAWAWTDGIDTPLNEQAELYEVIFGPLTSPVARWETSQPTLTIAADRLAALAAMNPSGSFAVRQRGDRGVSEPLLIPAV